ncbi:olfactory receptor 13F1-like [Gastrophryne carolinensis]
MYFFLCNLSIQDIIYVSSIFPKLLSITITHDNRISFQACFTQMFMFAACIDTEFLLLTSMAYDRYVAICIPLQYHLIMNKQIYICLAAASWLISSVNSYIFTILISKLSFCMRVNLNHFFCDLKTILKLSCTETSTMNNVIVIEIVLLGIVPFFLILTSYIFIISAILNIQTLQGKLRAFSNCSSHLIIVSVFCCTVLSLYIKPASEDSEEIDKLLSLLYAVMVPVLNPLVYTLRNKEFLKAIKDVIGRKTLM